jgi:type IV secretion system protein VirD4
MTTQRPQSTPGDEFVNFGIAALISCAVLALVLRGAGSAAAWATGISQPSGGIETGIAVLFNPGNPSLALGSPGLSPIAFWLVASLLLALVGSAGYFLWRLFRQLGHTTETDPYRIQGIATRADVLRAASTNALMRRARHLRPSLAKAAPSDVGYRIGNSRGADIWASVEDSTLVIGPPRSGKGAHIVINTILDAPGAVVATSTRPDNLTATLRARQQVGPVARIIAVRGSSQPRMGDHRSPDGTPAASCWGSNTATGLAAGGVDGGGFWEAKTRTALQALLHAAALDHRSPGELFRWTLDPAAAHDAVSVLHSTPSAATGWGDSLQAMLESDPRTRDSIWQGVSLSLGALADPRVLDAVSPSEGESFDPEAFIHSNGTLYLLATGAGSNNSAALVSALVEDLVETARRIAARSPGARLDPPMLLALDEIGNLAPLPSLPTLMAEGGGTGITTMPVLQSLAQARTKWSDNAASSIWDSSIVKIILGGASNSRDLQDLSTLIGERDDATDSTTVGDRGSRSSQRSVRRVAIMPPDRIRTLPFGTGLILLRAAPPVVARLRMWTARSDADDLRANRAEIETLLRTPSNVAPADDQHSDD